MCHFGIFGTQILSLKYAACRTSLRLGCSRTDRFDGQTTIVSLAKPVSKHTEVSASMLDIRVYVTMLEDWVVHSRDRCHIASAHHILTYLIKAVHYIISNYKLAEGTNTHNDVSDEPDYLRMDNNLDRIVYEYDLSNARCGTYRI